MTYVIATVAFSCVPAGYKLFKVSADEYGIGSWIDIVHCHDVAGLAKPSSESFAGLRECF